MVTGLIISAQIKVPCILKVRCSSLQIPNQQRQNTEDKIQRNKLSQI